MMHPSSLTLLALAAAVACDRGQDVAARPTTPAGAVRLTPQQIAAARIAVDTVALERVMLPLAVPATAATPDPLSVRVGSIVEGRIDAVAVLPGDRVPAGAELVRIHSHEAATALRDRADADAQVAFAQAAFERSSRLLAAEAVSMEEVERRRMALDQAKAEQVRSREVVRHLNPSPDGEVVIRAPKGGTVFAVHVRPGEAVLVGAPLVELGDASRLWVTGYLPENAAVHFARGSGVKVRFDAMPDSVVDGTIVRIGAMVDSLRRAVEVRAELTRVPTGIRPGMFGSLLLPAADAALRAVVPAEAVQHTADGDVVFVGESPELFRARPVRATILPDGRAAIDSLPPGLGIVTRGGHALKAELERAAPGGE
jgi:RND family efflux transporter MFP subunit